jgi:hypothetical protein
MKLICRTDLSLEHRIIKAFVAGALFFCLFIVFIVPPAHLPFVNCTFHSITGHSCLTCGMTRSLHAIMHGNFTASVRYHLFGPAVFIAMLLGFVILTTEAIRGKKSALPVGSKIRSKALIVFAIVWLVYWGARLAAEFSS